MSWGNTSFIYQPQCFIVWIGRTTRQWNLSTASKRWLSPLVPTNELFTKIGSFANVTTLAVAPHFWKIRTTIMSPTAPVLKHERLPTIQLSCTPCHGWKQYPDQNYNNHYEYYIKYYYIILTNLFEIKKFKVIINWEATNNYSKVPSTD